MNHKHHSQYLFHLCLLTLSVLLIATIPISSAWASEASDNGEQWLLQNPAADSSWRSTRDVSGIRSTARALAALGTQAPAEAELWLVEQTARMLEETAAVALVLGTNTPEGMLTPVHTHKTEDGPWGSAFGMAPDPFHTALALLTLTYTETGQAADIAAAADYLAATQNSDGSWSAGEVGQETAVTTAVAVQALLSVGISPASSEITLARQWLFDHQNQDGGWGMDGSRPAVTARVLAVLRWLGCPLDVETLAVQYLEGMQQADGSWESDPWTTALAVRALSSAGLPDLGYAVGSVIADPDPVPGDPWQLTATIVNHGAVAAANVTVRFRLEDETGNEITFKEEALESIGPGDEIAVIFPVDTLIPAGTYTWYVHIDPDDYIREGDETDNHRQGTIVVGGWRNFAMVPDSVGFWTWDGLLELDPSALTHGTQVLIKARVSVEGTHGANNVEVWVYWGDPADGILIGSVVIDEIPEDGTVEINLPWIVDRSAGPGSITVVVDPRGLIAQTDTTNDRVDLTLEVGGGDTTPPEAPAGLVAHLESRDRVDLSWWPSESKDVVGYRLYRNGIPINAKDLAPESTPSASDSYNLREYIPEELREAAAFDPPNMTDGDPETSWWSIQLPFEEWEPEKCWVQFDFDKPESFRGIIVQWFDFDYAGKDFRVQTWDGTDWVEQVEIEDNILDRTVIILDEAVVTDKVRIRIVHGLMDWFVAVREVNLLEAGPGRVITEPRFVDTRLPRLPATYTVTAVDAAGNESAPSDPFVLEDLRPPIVDLALPIDGQRVGPKIFVIGTVTDEFLQGYALDWVEGDYRSENPVDWNRAGQRAEPVVNGDLLSFTPPKGLDCLCTLRLVAMDGGGVRNIREERITVWIDTVPPERPVGLAWSQSEDKVYLTWDPNTDSDLAGYYVMVNGEEDGLCDVSSEGTALASQSYSDAFVERSPDAALDEDRGTYWRPPDESYPCWWQVRLNTPQAVRRVSLRWMAPMIPRRFRIETLSMDGWWITRWSTNDNVSINVWADFETAAQVQAVRVVILEGASLGERSQNSPLELQALSAPRAPYPALADVVVLAEKMLTEAAFETAFNEKREYGLTVEAVDDMGNRSSVSQAAVIDLLGPRVAIFSPKWGEDLGRAVVVKGVVEDRYLKDYVIEVGPIPDRSYRPSSWREIVGPPDEPAYWEEIYRSMSQTQVVCPFGDTPIRNEMMTVWYPTLQQGWYALRLTARDQFDHVSVARVDFTIDAMPPEPPSNLTAVESEENVDLSWDPSLTEADGSEPLIDLAGYRVYRDSIPLTVHDVAFLGHTTAPVMDPELQGQPSFMIDAFGGSAWMPYPFSEQAEVIVDLPQPFLISEIEIEWARCEWLWGKDYTVDVWDQEAESWIEVGVAEESIAPNWRTEFPAFATDRIRVTLMEGPTPFSLGAIAEIHVYRETDPSLLTTTSYTDPIPIGEEASYRVTALDLWGNESPKSNRVLLDGIPPRVALTAPSAGELRFPAGTRINIMGTIDDPLLREYLVEVGEGENPVIWNRLTSRTGELVPILTPTTLAGWNLPEEVEGHYTFRLSALDQGDRRTEDRVTVYIDTLAPQAPTGLVAAVMEGGVQLDWNAVQDPRLAGYHVFRNGKRLDLADIAVNGKPKASSFLCSWKCTYPEYAIDGDLSTSWMNMKLQVPAWLRLMFDGFFPISGIEIDFSPYGLARDFELQSWDRETESWQDVATVTDLAENSYEVTFSEPIRIERFRIRMTRGLDMPTFGIREIHLMRAPGAETPVEPHFFDDATGDLEYTYRVTAFDEFGNESIPSNEVPVDEMNPRVTITWPEEGARVGAHVEVEGTVEEWRLLEYRLEVGAGEDPESYEVVDIWEKPVEENVAAVWDAPAGEDGPWRIRLVARDLSGRETAVDRLIWLDTTPPAIPLGFTAQTVGEHTVQLRWDAVEADDLVGYQIYRDGRLLNDPLVSAWGEATASKNADGAVNALDAQYSELWDVGGSWSAVRMPAYWEESFDSAVTVDRVELYWLKGGFCAVPRDYEFQVYDGEQWNTLLMTWDNAFQHRIQSIPVPDSGTRFRLLVTAPECARICLGEVRLWDHSLAGPITDTYYLDEGIVEIGWTYQVSAVDDLGNESRLTDPILLDDRPPEATITFPGSDDVVSGTISVTGTAKDLNLHHWLLEVGVGEEPLSWQEIGFGGLSVEDVELAQWTPPNDVDDTYTFRLTAYDRAGHLSQALTSVAVVTRPPSMPQGLTAAVEQDGAVRLSWSPSEYGDVVGYNIYRDGEKLNRIDLAPLGTATSSLCDVNQYPPENALDGDLETIWAPMSMIRPAWFAVEFDQKFRIQGIVVHWYEDLSHESPLGEGLVFERSFIASDYQIQIRDDHGEWRSIVFIENNRDVRRVDPFPEVVETNGIRILVSDGIDWAVPGAIREVQILSADAWDLITETSFVDTGLPIQEGVYTVTAVDAYDHESIAATMVVDEEPPRLLVTYPMEGDRVPRHITIAGRVEDKTLSEIEVAYQVAGGEWQVARRLFEPANDAEITSISLEEGYEGPGALRIRAWDKAGNESEHLVQIIMDDVAPDTPTNVFVSPTNDSGAHITWSPSSAEDLDGYLVKRGWATLNPGNLVEAAVASASDVYYDSEYHQPWAAIDTLPNTAWWSGNHSGPKVLEVAFPDKTSVNRITIAFASHPFVHIAKPVAFTIEAMLDYGWQILAEEVNWGSAQGAYYLTLPESVLTNRIRFRVTRASTFPWFIVGVSQFWVFGPGLVTETEYWDTGLSVNEATYRVVAQDEVGNQSAASEPAYLDFLPPRVELTRPESGALAASIVTITGAVQDTNLDRWELSWGYGETPEAWEPIDVRYANLHSGIPWDASGIEGPVTLRLWAEDLAGNQAEARVSLAVDGGPPTCPTDMSAVASDNGVLLSWSASSATDVTGYLVYRDGICLTAADITPFGRAWASSDGEYSRGAGAAIDDNTGTKWYNDRETEGQVLWGIDFDEPFLVNSIEMDFLGAPTSIVAESWDGLAWTVLVTISDNTSSSRTFTFSPTLVSHVRLRFPAVTGTVPSVELYEVRIVPSGPTSAIDALSYLDSGVSDPGGAEHAWSVASVDQAGNIGPRTQGVIVDALAPRVSIDTPTEGQLVGRQVEISGSVAERFLSSWTLTAYVEGLDSAVVAQGTETVAGLLGVWDPPEGWIGSALLQVSAEDTSGHIAEAGVTVSADNIPPSPPSQPVVTHDIDGLRVSWHPPPDEDVAGYIVYRNGEPIQTADLTRLGSIVSSGFYSPQNAIDNDPSSIASRSSGSSVPYWGLTYATPHEFTALAIDWGRSCYVPSAFRVEVLQDGTWLTVHHVEDEDSLLSDYCFDLPVIGRGIRIRTSSASDSMGLAEVTVETAEAVPITATVYRDTVLERWFHQEAVYQVAAIDAAGNLGTLSEATIWDVTGPRLEIASPVAGSTVPGEVVVIGTVTDPLLAEWTLEASVGGNGWDLLASGTDSVRHGPLATWTPEQGFEASARLRLWAEDQGGNETTVETSFEVDAAPPSPPSGLHAEITEGGAHLTWESNGVSDLSGYRIYRDGLPLTGDIVSLAEVTDLAGKPIDKALDGDPNTTCAIYGSPSGLEAVFDYQPTISMIRLWFAEGPSYPLPVHLTLETWTGTGWLTIAEIWENSQQEVVLAPASPYSGDRFRVVIRSTSGSGGCRLASLEILLAGSALLSETDFRLDGLLNHQDAYTVTAVDALGNESTPSDPVILDTTPPVVEITSPAPGDTVGSALIGLRGTISDLDLSHWTASWRRSDEPDTWTTFATGTECYSNYHFAWWRPPAEESSAVLRVETIDSNGNSSVKTVDIDYDHLGPRVSLDVGSRYWAPGELNSVGISLEDANFKRAYLSIDYNWTSEEVLATLTEPAIGHVETIDTSGWPEGAYPIILTAWDDFNQNGQQRVTINVAPVILDGEWTLVTMGADPFVPVSASAHDNELWVLDSEGNVHLVGMDGMTLASLPGEYVERVSSPTDIAVTQERMWVLGSSLSAYFPDGYPLGSFSVKGRAIAALPDESIVLLNSYRTGVSVLDSQGQSMGSFSLPGVAEDMAVDRFGLVYALMSDFGTVEVFDAQGNPFASIPLPTRRSGATIKPQIIAMDTCGRMAFAKCGGDGEQIVIISPNGEVLTRFGLHGTGPQEVYPIVDLAFVGDRLAVITQDGRRLDFIPLIPGGMPASATSEIHTPADGASVNGGMPIVGTVWHEPSTSWVLEVGEGDSPAEWSMLTQGNGPSVQSNLFPWDTRDLGDGLWTLRLTVDGETGVPAEALATVRVDNENPVAQIIAPIDGTVISGVIDIVGTASDADLLEYTLMVERVGYGAAAPTLLTSGTASVIGEPLASWDVDATGAGFYKLRLEATDKAGNRAEDEVTVSVGGVTYVNSLASGLLGSTNGVAKLEDGHWVVLDTTRVLIVSSNGELLDTITTNDLDNPFRGLCSAAALPGGGFAVLDEWYERVSVYDADWNLLFGFGDMTGGLGKCEDPIGLVVDGQGRFIVLDKNNGPTKGYHVFSQEGEPIFSVCGQGETLGSFSSPVAIGVDRTDNVYVLDCLFSGSGRIQIFDEHGVFLEAILLESIGLATKPECMTVGPDGFIVLIDCNSQGADQVFLLSPEGALLASWGEYGSAAGLLRTPYSVWMGDGIAAIGDSGKHSLEVFDLSLLLPEPPFELTATMAYPFKGELLPARVRITGTAAGNGMTAYRLEVGEGNDPETWIQLESGAEPVSGGVLATLDLSSMQSGEITIRLVVEAEGSSAEHRVTCDLDNQPPIAEILSPEEYGLLRENELVSFRVQDDRSVTYRLTLGRDDRLMYWTTLSEEEPVVSDLSAEWLPEDFPPGVYRLTLSAIDSAGNCTKDDHLVSTGSMRYAGLLPIQLNESESIYHLAPDGGGLLVATNRRVMFLDATANFVSQTDKVVPFTGDMAALPGGVVTLRTGSYSGLVSVYDREGNLIRSFGSSQPGIEELSRYPTSVTVDDQGRILVLDQNRIVGFSMEGEYLGAVYTMESGGSGKVGVDGYGNMYILHGVKSVEVISSSATPIATFGENGDHPLSGGNNLAVDSLGRVAVLGTDLSLWTVDGRFLGYSGGDGYCEGWGGYTSELVYGSNDRLYLLRDRRIAVYDLSEMFAHSGEPYASLSNPLEGAYLTGMIPIVGTAAGGAAYSVSLIGQNTNILLADGTPPIVEGILGMLDVSILDEDSYFLKLSVIDDGEVAMDEHQVYVDKEAPLVSLLSPQNYSNLGQPTSVTAMISDSHLLEWVLDLGYKDNSGEHWTVIASGSKNADGEIGIVNPEAHDPRTYVLRLRATDYSGHVSEARKTVSIGPVTLVNRIETVPGEHEYTDDPGPIAFFPDGSFFLLLPSSRKLLHYSAEGRFLKELTLPPEIYGPGQPTMYSAPDCVAFVGSNSENIYVSFLNQDGIKLDSLDVPKGSGPGKVEGIVDLVVAEDGVLFIETTEVEAFDIDGDYVATWGEWGEDPGEFFQLKGGTIDPFGRVLLLDYQGRLHIYSVDGSYRGEMSIDRNAYLIATDPLGNFAVFTGYGYAYAYTADGCFLTRFGGSGDSPGLIKYVTGIAFDPSGNFWIQDRTAGGGMIGRLQGFEVDWRALTSDMPEVDLIVPEGGAFVPSESWIIGRVEGVEPLSWNLSVGQGEDPTYWWSVSQGKEPVPIGTLGVWDARGRPEGTCTVRLLVEDGVGSTTEIRRQVTLDTTPPEILLRGPAAHTMLTSDTVAVTGGIAEANLDRYYLKYLGKDEDHPHSTEWWTIAAGTVCPETDLLGNWHTHLLDPSVYRLKLWAIDVAGNLSIFNRDLSVCPIEYMAGESLPSVPSVTASNPMDASRDGRIAVTSEDRTEIHILNEQLIQIDTFIPEPPEGSTWNCVEWISFAQNGDLIALCRSNAPVPYRASRWSADGGRIAVMDLAPTADALPGEARDMLAISPTQFILLSFHSTTGFCLKLYSFEEGYQGMVPYPQDLIRFPEEVDRYPGEGFVVYGRDSSSAQMFLILDAAGTLVEVLEPQGGWPSDAVISIAVDGTRAYYVTDGDADEIHKYDVAGNLVWSMPLTPYSSYPGHCLENPVLMTGKGSTWFTFERNNGRLQAFRAHDEFVDIQAPVTSLDPSLADAPLMGEVEIHGTVDDTFLYSWTLKALPNGLEQGAILLAEGSGPVVNATLAIWETTAADGDWILVLEVNDTSGNTSSTSLEVTVLNLPTPVLDQPVSPTIDTEISVTGTGLSGTTAIIFLNGTEAVQTPIGSNNQFEALLGPLVVSDNTITARLQDASGALGPISAPVKVSWDCSVDIVPPTVTVIGVENNAYYNTTVTPVVTVLDEHLVSQSVALNGQPFVSGTAVTEDGAYSLTVTASDCAPNTTVVEMHFTIDTVPPTVDISPVGSPTDQTSQTITGTMEANVLVNVVVDTTGTTNEVTYSDPTTWACQVTGLVEGPNRITATATDAAGNSASASATITLVVNHSPVLDPIGDHTVYVGDTLSFVVTANDPDGTIPVIPVDGLPQGASFDGTTFVWTPGFDQAQGDYSITFTADDGELSDSEIVTVTLVSTNRSPSVPEIASPLDREEVAEVQPELSVENSTDPDGDRLTYHFEVYVDEAMTNQVASGTASETEAFTSWMVTEELTDNTWYYWRVRATDDTAYTLWQYGCFFVNTENDPPASFAISSPQDDTEVDTLQPTLEVTNSTDTDHDLLTYTFEVYADSGMSTLIATEADIDEGEHGTTCWQVSSALTENTRYFWRAIAMDEHGAQTATPLASFLVNTLNHAPTMIGITSPASGSEVETQALDLVVTNASDQDADGLIYIFELDRVHTFDSPAKVTSGQILEGTGTTSWYVSDLIDNTLYYWRAKASDSSAESAWVYASFFVNTANDNPATPTVKNPGPMAWVETSTPALEVNRSQDVDLDSVSYEFELYADPSLSNLIAQGTSDIGVWVLPSPLDDRNWYYWRARAKDEHDALSAWTDPVSFFVIANEVTLVLDAGWSMVSLPIDAIDKRLKAVFPNAVVVYRYEKGTGYLRVLNNEELKVGKGYWILLDQATSYTISGQAIESYTHPIYEDGWSMIGGCTDPAQVISSGCDIGVIYGYTQGIGYERVLASERLESGKGYWILLTNVTEGGMITVETDD